MYVHQSIRDPHGVTAFGSHMIGVEPDRASIACSIVDIAKRPEQAFESVEKMRTAVSAVLKRYNIPTANISVSRVAVDLAVEGYGKDRVVLGYRAQLDYTIATEELSTVSALVTDLVNAGARAISSVRYSTTQIRELRARAREQAFESARIKAENYARAAGLKLGRALHIEDINPDALTQRSHAPDIDLTSHDELEATTGSIKVSGAVLVCFALVDI